MEVFTPPCDPGAERFSAVAHCCWPTSRDGAALPERDACAGRCTPNRPHSAHLEERPATTSPSTPTEIAVSNVEDRQAAVEELDGLVKLVNRTWERRDEITPDHTTRQRPTAMAVYKLLPGTNCRQCGQPTCWNFALKLVAAQVELAACPPLRRAGLRRAAGQPGGAARADAGHWTAR